MLQSHANINADAMHVVPKRDQVTHTLIHHHPDTVIIDSSIITRTRIQPHHPSSPGYGYWQYKSNSTQWELTSPECICMHNTSMQHSTQVMTTSDIINHHQPQHDIITSINMPNVYPSISKTITSIYHNNNT